MGALALVAAACGTDPSSEDIGTATAALAERLAEGGTLVAASELPPEWPASRDGLRVYDLGKIPLSKEGDSYDGELLAVDEGSDAGADVYEEPTTEVVAFDVASRHAYRVVADLSALEDELGHLLREAPQEAEPNELQRILDGMEDLGWSDGVDNRILINSANFGNGSPYSHIGATGNGSGICTATLIGPSSPGRFALTAAHCVTTASGWSNYPIMIPRQNGTGTGATPFGTWNVNWMMVPSQWFSQSCNVDAADPPYATSCVTHDIALMQVVSPSGLQDDPGWMSYNALSEVGGSQLASSVSKRIYGYPGCPPTVDAPSSCPSGGGYLYGQPTSHTLGSWAAEQSGYYRRANFSADTSKGMSGSALFKTNSSGGAPFVAFGVDASSTCSGSGCVGVARPNRTRLIDWDWGILMAAHMNP